MAGQVRGEGHESAYLVHIMKQPEIDVRRLAVSVTDATTGWFQAHNQFFTVPDFEWSSDRLDIRTPTLTWVGDATRQTISVTTPWGALDIALEAEGPVMFYGGNGSYCLLDLTQTH